MSDKNINDIDESLSNVNINNFKAPNVPNQDLNAKQKVIIFCIPGNKFNSKFILCWSELILKCLVNNYRPILCQENDRNIFIERNKCLGGNILQANKNQKPFQGNVKYDYIVWINPNVIFTFQDLEKLLKSDYDVTSGVYTLSVPGDITNVVQNFDYKFYKENGTFNFLTNDTIVKMDKINNRYFEADFVDFGWVCLKKEISEKIDYPWFESYTKDEKVSLFTDSYSYCKKLKEKGVKIMVDSNIKMNYSEL
jgi:hypothetical protein